MSDIKIMVYKMGEKISLQEKRFCELKQGLQSSENVLHIVDLASISPHEKDIIKEYYRKKVKYAKNSEG